MLLSASHCTVLFFFCSTVSKVSVTEKWWVLFFFPMRIASFGKVPTLGKLSLTLHKHPKI